LTPESIETVLADFRSWLQQMATQPPLATNAPAVADVQPGEEVEPLDLHTLLAQFVAVRHEVNLQTKAVRAQQGQNAEALHQLERALETLQATQAAARQADRQAQDEVLRPLLKTLVDSHDALALAAREVQRVQDVALPLLTQATAAAEPATAPPLPPSRAAPRPFWGRWFSGRGEHPETSAHESVTTARQHRDSAAWWERQRQVQEAGEQVVHLLDSVITGYTMSLRRMERTLQQYGLEAIPCVGRPFDPELMEVVEVVTDPGRPSAEVTDEVRRGYLWQGRVFRYAQVRVARP
jgi:molecular chaperone GrpE